MATQVILKVLDITANLIITYGVFVVLWMVDAFLKTGNIPTLDTFDRTSVISSLVILLIIMVGKLAGRNNQTDGKRCISCSRER